MKWTELSNALLTGLPVIAEFFPGSKIAMSAVTLIKLGIGAINRVASDEAQRRGLAREQLLNQIDAGFANIKDNLANDDAELSAKLAKPTAAENALLAAVSGSDALIVANEPTCALLMKAIGSKPGFDEIRTQIIDKFPALKAKR